MRRRTASRAAAALGLALAAAAAVAQVTPGTAARVNGEPISVQALERGFEQELRARNLNIAAMRRPDKVAEIRREVLERLIREALLWQKAQRDGLVAGDAEVDRAIERTAGQFKTRESFERRIARDGFDRKSYREHARRLLSAERAAQALVEGKLVVSDEEVEAFYRANRALFHRPEQLRLRVLRVGVPPGASPEASREARSRIDALRARLAAGEDFDALARQFSDHATRPWGGALEPVARGQLPPALEAAAFALRRGELSEVIELPEGFQLLRLEERLPEAEVRLEDARARIRDRLAQQRGREVLDREVAALRAASTIEVLLPL